MSLKYKVFMLKGTAGDLHKRLLETYPRSIDESDLMHQAYDWCTRPSREGFPIEKRSFELKSYMKDNGQTGFHIWFMDHPKKAGFVVGGYTSIFIRSIDYTAVFCIILEKCGIEEVLFQSYSGVVNDGDIVIWYLNPIDSKNFPHHKREDQFWNRYINRVDPICGYPVKSWHNYLDHQFHLVPWKFSIRLKDRPWIKPGYGNQSQTI